MRKKSKVSAEHIHPYKRYEGTPLWRALNEGIGDLVQNQDLKEHTKREYVVGHLCSVIMRRKVGIFLKSQDN